MVVHRPLNLRWHFVFRACAVLAFAFAGVSTAQVPTYNVGSTPTGVPFTFLDVKTNTIQGAMVDLITAIGEDAGFKVNVQATPFSALIPSLTSRLSENEQNRYWQMIRCSSSAALPSV